MTITTKWIKQPNIPSFIFSSRVNDEDIDALGQVGLEIAASGIIYPVIDFSAVTTMPRNLINTALRSRKFLAFISHSNVRLFVFVAPNEQTRSMLETVFRTIPYKIALSQQSAIKILDREIQGTGNPNSPPNRE